MRQSVNQVQKPITTQINDANRLEIGGCDLYELAQEYKTPLYVVDEATLRGVCQDYKKAFVNYPKMKFMYASKALCTCALTQIIDEEGFGFDVVSDGEIYTVYKSGVDMSKVLFNGNNKTSDELKLALELGVGRFSVDNFLELSLLNKLCNENNKTAKILLRITPGIECHTHEYIQTGHLDSKFGFDLTQVDEAIMLIKSEYKNLELCGLHAHVGSQIFETKIFKDEISILVSEIKRINNVHGLELGEINIGGGLGVKYTKQDLPPSIYEVADEITEALNKAVCQHSIEPPTVYLEPGRSIISTSGVTLYTIGSSKQVPNGRKYIAVDGGMADNPRPAMYHAQYDACIVNKAKDVASQKVTVAGRFCESGDILIENIALPKAENGDVLCIFNTGAYNYSMASNYNRTRKPAMVLVNNSESKVIIKRETLEDLIANDVFADRQVK